MKNVAQSNLPLGGLAHKARNPATNPANKIFLGSLELVICLKLQRPPLNKNVSKAGKAAYL